MRLKIFLWLLAVMSASGVELLIEDRLVAPASDATLAPVFTTGGLSTEGVSHEYQTDEIVADSADMADPTPSVLTVTEATTSVGTTEGHPSEETVTAEGTTEGNQSDATTADEAQSTENPAPHDYKVETTHGPVGGHLFDDNIIAYYDVVYGKIHNRFLAPLEPNAWTEVHRPEEHKIVCLQLTETDEVIGALDCLTLSIFKPDQVQNASVLFYIHGGELKSGSGDPHVYGPKHLVNKGLILVLPNYRLGPLGFLCMEIDCVPGNAALKDLTLALQWTEKNIEAFGGNPSNIVVSGDGLSSALAVYLALSPISSDYISKAITESGSVLSITTIDRHPLGSANALASALRNDNDTDIISVILQAELEDLISSSKGIKFKPCTEKSTNSFMDATAWDMISATEVKKPFMIGSASHAGRHDFMEYSAETILEINENFSHLLPDDLSFSVESERTDAANRVKKQYFDNNNITLDRIDELTLLLTDSFYLGPAIRTARSLLKAGANVFFYEFSFHGNLNRASRQKDIEFTGAARGDVVGYIFNHNGLLPSVDSEEEKMSNLMIDLWVTFIENGQPASDAVEWNELKTSDEENEEWLSIGSTTSLKTGLHTERLALWNQLYNQYFVDRNSGIMNIPKLTFLIVIVIYLLGFCDSLVY